MLHCVYVCVLPAALHHYIQRLFQDAVLCISMSVCCQPPSIPVKATRASLALRRTVECHMQHCIPARYNEASPLHWRKVRLAGSYEAESPLWHYTPTPTPASSSSYPSSFSSSSSSSQPKLPPPTPSGTATATVSMLSPRSGVDRAAAARSPSEGSTTTSMVSMIEISAGNVTKPKILHPSQRRLSALKPRTPPTATATAGSTSSGNVNGGGDTSVVNGTASSNPAGVSSSSSSSSSTVAAAVERRLYPLKLKVPSYMRMTTSCFVKRHLEPSFTNVYASLDFVEPTPSLGPQKGGGYSSARELAGVSRESAAPAATTGHRSSNAAATVSAAAASSSPCRSGQARRSVPAPLAIGSRTASGFTASLTAFSSSSPPPPPSSFPRVKSQYGAGAGFARCADVLHGQQGSSGAPNIRLNSSVFQAPKRTPVPTKIR